MCKARKKLLLVIMLICFATLCTTVYADEGDYGYYGYDESGGIYDFELLEQNAQIFEENTGIIPFVLITSYLGKDTTALKFAEEFYNDENNYNDIFSYSDYFILIISDEEEVMDIFVSKNASSILTNKMVSVLNTKYGSKVDNTEYHDVLVYDILTDAEEMILGNMANDIAPTKTTETNKTTNTVKKDDSTNSSIFSKLLIFIIAILLIGVILTKITFSFIHKRKKAEEEHELNLEKLYRNDSNETYSSEKVFNSTNTTQAEEKESNVTIDNSSSNVTHVTNVYESSYRAPNVGFIPTQPIFPPKHHHMPHHHEPHHAEAFSKPSPMKDERPKVDNTPKPSRSMTKPNIPAKRTSSSSFNSSSRKSSSSMKKPTTPSRRPASRTSGSSMRRPSTPSRRK